MTKLSILIPTLNEPESIRYLARLRGILDPQLLKYRGQAEIRIHDGIMTTNGVDRRNFIIRLGSRYEEVNGVYYRWPNHLTVMKRSCIEKVTFPAIWHGEDYQWSKVIHDRKLLKSEVFIDKDMYHYEYRTKAYPKRKR